MRYEGDVVVEGGHNRYVWDTNGRMVRRTEERKGFRPRTWRYEWDGFNRLLAVSTPEGQRWRYIYDAFGRRRAKRCETRAPTNPRRPALRRAEYLWDGPTVAAQWKTYADGTSEAPEQVQEWHYEAGGFTPLAVVQQRGGQAQMLHVVADINGAPRELLSNEGELVWAGQLDTWGRLARCHVQDADKAYRQQFFTGYRPAANDPVIDVELRFENQWADEESGLYYNLNRYYVWVDTMLGNIKTSIQGTYRAIRAKHLPRYLAEFVYRFNGRFDLASMIARLAAAAALTPPMPYRLVKLAEAHW